MSKRKPAGTISLIEQAKCLHSNQKKEVPISEQKGKKPPRNLETYDLYAPYGPSALILSTGYASAPFQAFHLVPELIN
jgi:hypothetical protein